MAVSNLTIADTDILSFGLLLNVPGIKKNNWCDYQSIIEISMFYSHSKNIATATDYCTLYYICNAEI